MVISGILDIGGQPKLRDNKIILICLNVICLFFSMRNMFFPSSHCGIMALLVFCYFAVNMCGEEISQKS